MSKKTQIALIYGGRSVEHDVSVISATNIYQNIDKDRFDVLCIGIDKSGTWFLMPAVDKDFAKGRRVLVSMSATEPSIVVGGESDALRLDVAFVILHGTDGEDGSIQGFFKVLGVPVVGAGVLGSSVSMNKVIAKKLLIGSEIPTARFVSIEKDSPSKPSYNEVASELGDTLIVKPASLGSSVGVSKVGNETDFSTAVQEAFKYDRWLVVEEFIHGRELECAVLGNHDALVSPPGEITLSKDYEVYSFDAKYVDGNAAALHIPADVQESVVENIKELALKAYKALACEDMARVDLFLTEDQKIYINEINTLPGFTNISMYPKLCELMGITYSELISRLIDLAMERAADNKLLQTEYISGLS